MRIIIFKILITLFLVHVISYTSYANNFDDTCTSEISLTEQNRKLWAVNLAGVGIVTAWGVAKWDYFSTSPKSTSEGWFENNTKSGGTDKLGHLYTSYVTTHGLSSLYKSWCIKKNSAVLYGALSSFIIVSYIEIGDSFSDHGFSKEDIIANSIGILFGYASYQSPQLTNMLDLRWEYKPNSISSDFTTDYENSKYLIALKLNAFNFARDNFLKHIEFHAGYYTRGFSDSDASKERNIFIGIGINFTDLLRRHSYNKTSTLLKYYQLPGSSFQSRKDLNK